MAKPRWQEYIDRLKGFEALTQGVDWSIVSADGVRFIEGARPERPVRVERLMELPGTRVYWADGTVEEFGDVELMEYHK